LIIIRNGKRLANELQVRRIVLNSDQPFRGATLYVCNCNGIREREARAAVEAGAGKPAEIFRHCQAAVRCAKCVCDLRRLIHEAKAPLRFAAE
jgi:bacterioferritin-associated ferredoxin